MSQNHMLRETYHTAYVVDSATGAQTYAVDTDPDKAVDKLVVKLLGG